MSSGRPVIHNSSFQVANNNRPGNDAQTKEIEELKKKLATKTQDLGMASHFIPAELCH